MTTLTQDVILELCQQGGDELCVSLYLPSQEDRQHPTAFKSLLREAERQLIERGLSAKSAEALVKPGYELLTDIWSLKGRNLGWFANAAGARLLTLDFPVEEHLFVQPGYYVKPLFWLDLYTRVFDVLAISLRGARLLQCTAAREEELELKNPPRGVDPQRVLEMAHAAGRTGHAAMQSHASRKELQKDIQQYITQLVKVTNRQFTGEPVVLAGVDELTSLFKKTHQNEQVPIMEGTIPGNPEDTPASRLRERAWELVAPFFKTERREALTELAQSQSQHGNSSVRIDEIVAAAHTGRVRTLLLPAAMRVMGRIEPETYAITINSSLEDAIDILNVCAAETARHGGKVYLFEPGTLPRPGATFRQPS